jgi:hypothetical protein
MRLLDWNLDRFWSIDFRVLARGSSVTTPQLMPAVAASLTILC